MAPGYGVLGSLTEQVGEKVFKIANLLDGDPDVDQVVEVTAERLGDVQFGPCTDPPVRIEPHDRVRDVVQRMPDLVPRVRPARVGHGARYVPEPPCEHLRGHPLQRGVFDGDNGPAVTGGDGEAGRLLRS